MIDPEDPADMSKEEHDYWEEQYLKLDNPYDDFGGDIEDELACS